jgi:hypothetical protein
LTERSLNAPDAHNAAARHSALQLIPEYLGQFGERNGPDYGLARIELVDGQIVKVADDPVGFLKSAIGGKFVHGGFV